MLRDAVVGRVHHAGNGREHGADDEGGRDDHVGADAHQGGHAGVLGGGAHRAAELGVVDQPHQHHQRERSDAEDHDLRGRNHRAGHVDGVGGQQVGIGLVGRLPDDHGQRLQQDRHADGGDQRSELGAVAQRPVGHLLDHEIEACRHDAGNDQGNEEDQPAGRAGHRFLHEADDGPACESPHHQHFPVREIDEVDDAVHHGVAQGYQGIHAAQDQTVDDLLQQYFHNAIPYVLHRRGVPFTHRGTGLAPLA
jgi:hypothetical protein